MVLLFIFPSNHQQGRETHSSRSQDPLNSYWSTENYSSGPTFSIKRGPILFSLTPFSSHPSFLLIQAKIPLSLFPEEQHPLERQADRLTQTFIASLRKACSSLHWCLQDTCTNLDNITHTSSFSTSQSQSFHRSHAMQICECPLSRPSLFIFTCMTRGSCLTF